MRRGLIQRALLLGVLGILLGSLMPAESEATNLPILGGLGGDPFRAECPRGSYLIGLAGRTGEWFDRIATVCAPWLPVQNTFGPAVVGPSYGKSRGGNPVDRRCGRVAVINGWEIQTLTSSNFFVRYLNSTCIGALSSMPVHQVVLGKPAEILGTESFPGSSPIRRIDTCPAGELATGIHGRAGDFLNAVGLICGPGPVKLGTTPASQADQQSTMQRPGTPIGSPGSTDFGAVATPRQAVPTILSPKAGQSYLFGQLMLRVAAPQTGATASTEFELTWLDDPGTPQWSNPIRRDTPVDLQGFIVPTNHLKGPGYLGRYQVRARATGQPVPGPWTLPIVFHLVDKLPPNLPTQSQSFPSSPMATTPPHRANTTSQASSALLPQKGPTFLYAVAPDGGVKWYRHNAGSLGLGLETPNAWTGPIDIIKGWNQFVRVFSGGPNIMYGIDAGGNLKWLRHDGLDNGIAKWSGPTQVGNGWSAMKHVFSAAPGIVYALEPNGNLFWYRHVGMNDGTTAWANRTQVGNGWQDFRQVFGACNGVMYAIAQDGTLRWYKHLGWQTGATQWANSMVVGTNWHTYRQVFAGCNGIIYTVAQDGTLLWHKHLGAEDGSNRWEGPKPVGRGWQNFTTVVAAKY